MKLILACDPKGGIGYQNKLPWDKLQGDLPRFKALTSGQPIVMGRNTWDSLPKKPLPNRYNYVVTSTNYGLISSGEFITLEVLLGMKPELRNNIWLIGGAKLVNSCWDYVQEVHLSKTVAEYTCDTFIDLSYLQDKFAMVEVNYFEDHEYQIWKRK